MRKPLLCFALVVLTIVPVAAQVTGAGQNTAIGTQTKRATSNPDITKPTLSAFSANPSSSLATICWEANEFADGQINLATASGGPYNAQTVSDATLLGSGVQRCLQFSNLNSSTQYWYTIRAADVAGNVTVCAADSTPRCPSGIELTFTTSASSSNDPTCGTVENVLGTGNPLDPPDSFSKSQPYPTGTFAIETSGNGGLTRAAGVSTVKLTTTPNVTAGMWVHISGAGDASFNSTDKTATSVTKNSGSTTVTVVSASHNMYVGQRFTLSGTNGSSPDKLHGFFTVAGVIDANTFTFTVETTDTSTLTSTTGTIKTSWKVTGVNAGAKTITFAQPGLPDVSVGAAGGGSLTGSYALYALGVTERMDQTQSNCSITLIKRRSDMPRNSAGNLQSGFRVHYTTRRGFSLDKAYYAIRGTDSGIILYKRSDHTVYWTGTSNLSQCDLGGFVFSPTNADKAYCTRFTGQLYEFTLSTKTGVLVRNFATTNSCQSGVRLGGEEGDLAETSLKAAIHCPKADGSSDVLIYNIATDTVLASVNVPSTVDARLDNTHINDDGSILVNMGKCGSGNCGCSTSGGSPCWWGWESFDSSGTYLGNVQYRAGHGDIAQTTTAKKFVITDDDVVGPSNCLLSASFRDYTSMPAAAPGCALNMGLYNQGGHIGAYGDWVFIVRESGPLNSEATLSSGWYNDISSGGGSKWYTVRVHVYNLVTGTLRSLLVHHREGGDYDELPFMACSFAENGGAKIPQYCVLSFTPRPSPYTNTTQAVDIYLLQLW